MPRLLVVDDEAGIRMLVLRIAHQAGFAVTEAGESASLRQALTEVYDVIALDLAMPDIDGIEVIRELAQLGCTANIILISGFDRRVLDTAARIASGLGLKLKGALSKPFSVVELLALLRADHQAPGVDSAQMEITSGQLRQAIEAGQLLLHYQPQVAFADGHWHGVEALLRWQHPRYGLIYPGSFIDIAETDEFAMPVVHAVLEMALSGYAKLMKSTGFDGTLAINIPARALSDVHMPEQLLARIGALGVPHQRLVFEVTESSLANQHTVAADILARMRIKGFALSIDDFGTGYSSLESLHRLPFTELKIDMQFVQAAETDSVARAIVENSIELAKQLSMRVVAEGVQTAGQWRWLKERGCDVAQGFLISRGLPADDLGSWREDLAGTNGILTVVNMRTVDMEKTERVIVAGLAGASGRVLAVDDEPFYLRLIENYLQPAGFDVVGVERGSQALDLLRTQGDGFDAVLLDRGMPDVDGMRILTQIKDEPRLRELPVIIQTGLAEPLQVAEGIAHGAYYYLAKPFSREVLCSLVAAAVNEYAKLRSLRSQLQQADSGHALLRRGEFVCRTLADVQALASHLARFFPEPSRVIAGIAEFLTNAVEHGNLGISYAEKSQLLREGRWQEEVERRLRQPENKDKMARAELECLEDRVRLTVRDAGTGFDWRTFVDLDPARAFDLHGRGIALSRLMSFDTVEYNAAGNVVHLTVMRRP